MSEQRMYPVEEAIRAQKALRAASGLEPEMFPVQAFVGMISDEIEILRKRGQSDRQIVHLIRDNSLIEISEAELAEHYAPPEQRRNQNQ